MTLSGAVEAATARLRAHSDSPRLDAQLLLAAALGKPRSHLIAWADQPVPAAALARFEDWVAQRAAGTPVAYLTGRKEFWSLELEVTPQVLAPRPETELLVERALAWLPAGGRALDLGTGSGAIALAMASERPRAQVWATDLSAAALEVARLNARRLGFDNVHFHAGDWYAALPAEARFDVIISNPPYIAAGDPAMGSAELSAEPPMALSPGPRGLEAIEKVAEGAVSRLLPGGWLAVEHGAAQGPDTRALLTAHGLIEVTTCPDLAGHERVTCGRAPLSAPADYRDGEPRV